MKYLLSCVCLTFSIFSSAGVYSGSAPLHSSLRGYREPAAAALQRYRQRLAQFGVRSIQEDSPLGLAKPLEMLTYEKVPVYQNAAVAIQSFAKVRDVKFIKDSAHNMLRRSSWLFPDDGCFARAALAVQNLKAWNRPAPAKLFIFGNLTVKTNNSPQGSVSWWYHVVPIIMVGQQPVIFDPAINPSAPMYLKDWIATMTNDLKTVSFSICKPTTYAPSSPCSVDSTSSEPALDHQMMYLDAEWARLLEMKREPMKELGDYPPWLQREQWRRF